MATKMRAKEVGAQRKSGTVGDLVEKQRANMDYLRNHYDELWKKYPNHWVIVSGGRVVDVESNAGQFIESIIKTRSRNRLLYYLASPEKSMLL